MNKFIGIGRITKDIELKTTQSGKSVASFTLAINRLSKHEGQPEADFINCVAWNQTAELMSKYTGKGSLVAVEGRIQVRNYDDQHGKKVYVTEVVADRVQFLGSKTKSEPETYNYNPEPEPELDIGSDELPF